MQGQILQVDTDGGLILGDDGSRYGFSAADWKPPLPALSGIRVDFMVAEGAAREIFPLGRTAAAAAAAPVGSVGEGNSVLLGALGIVCLVLSFVIPVLPVIPAFILGLVGASSAKRYGNATGLTLSRIAWIGAVVLAVLGVLLIIWGVAFAWPFLTALFVLMMTQSGTVA